MTSDGKSRALHLARGYASGGAPKGDWRSDVDAPRPHYAPDTGEWVDPDKWRTPTLTAPERSNDPTRTFGERALDTVLDYGAAPAKGAIGQAMRSGESLAEAERDPSIANLTNAGVQTGLALLQPMRALKLLGLGYGAAGAKDLGLLGMGAQAEDGALTPDQQSRLAALQKKQQKGVLSRAEREEQNNLLGIQRDYAAAQSKSKFESEARQAAAKAEVEAKKGTLEAETAAEAKRSAQTEFDRATKEAVRGKNIELSRYKPFSETEVGKVYDKLGIATPALAAVGAGALTRGAAAISGGKGPFVDYGAPALMGAGTAGVMANWPLGHELVFAPALNPERRAFEVLARDLPLTTPDGKPNPEKEAAQKYAQSLKEKNPARELASEEFYDPIKFAERTGFGVVEGLVSGLAGAEGAKWAARAPRAAMKSISTLPGELGEAAARSQAKAVRADQSLDRLRRTGDELVGVESEAQRRLSAPGGASGLSGEAQPLRQPPALGSTSSPTSQASRASSEDPTLRSTVDQALPSPTDPVVLIRTKDARGYQHHRNLDGKFASSPKKKGKGDPEPEERKRGGAIRRALDTARRYATGGRVLVGPVMGGTGGRADELPVEVPAGAYVIPADVVSAAGEGNTLAGVEQMKKLFGEATTRATGGAVEILISDGEYVLSPEQVIKVGGGDMARGHQVLDSFVKKARAAHIKTLQSLPGPAKA